MYIKRVLFQITQPQRSSSVHSSLSSSMVVMTIRQDGTSFLSNSKPILCPDLDSDDLPPLPEIKSDDIRLQVYTHRSYFARPTHMFEDMPDDPSPDNEKLEHLGDSVLSLVVTSLMREEFPLVRVGPSTKMRALVVGNPTLADLSLKYRLPEKLRMHPAQAITLRVSTNIQADLFEAFVGGLYMDRGLEVVRAWLYPLLRPYLHDAYRHVRIQHGLPPEPPPHASPSPPAPPPASAHPEPPRTASSIGHLSLFNQHLQQQGKAIEWVWADSAGQGSRTTPIWVVRAMVDNACLGGGRGSTKKAAKNEAAKEGLRNLGIDVSCVHSDSYETRSASDGERGSSLAAQNARLVSASSL
ncbi:ribonuclease III [Wolfiporia cocos MD-104 SS10]|uniref:Ribonuclease III n=1 Tax=Wolfiporia cocos (strain MD-104) TaxID=742152 RepID=A0A2H3JW38_WOLCO|nr:ribonuclease III [Wolfiporia cocos MD-104 SS10]